MSIYPILLSKRPSLRKQWGDPSTGTTLEPSEFCRRWLPSPAPGEWGYRRACIKLLAEATGLSERSIENWGKDFSQRPDYVLTVLEKDNALREIQQVLDQLRGHQPPKL